MSALEIIVIVLEVITLSVLGYVFKFYMPSYFQEKGKNLATKEDVEEITKKVESVKAEVRHSTKIGETKYHLKYEACLEALALIDAYFSHSLNGKITKQYSKTENARSCHSKLILSCEDIELIELFNEIMFGPGSGKKPRKPATDLLNDFRNLIRMELGFGKDLPLDRDRAWFGKVICEK